MPALIQVAQEARLMKTCEPSDNIIAQNASEHIYCATHFSMGERPVFQWGDTDIGIWVERHIFEAFSAHLQNFPHHAIMDRYRLMLFFSQSRSVHRGVSQSFGQLGVPGGIGRSPPTLTSVLSKNTDNSHFLNPAPESGSSVWRRSITTTGSLCLRYR